MAVADYWRVAFQYECDGQTNVNVLHFLQVGQPTDTDAQAVASRLGPLLAEAYKGILPTTQTDVRQCDAYLISRTLTDQGSIGLTMPTGGLTRPPAGALPSLCAVVARLRTGVAGRRHRGRIYLGGVPNAWETDGLLTTAGVTGYGLWAADMIAKFGGPTASSGYQLGVFSRAAWKEGLSEAKWFTPITQISIMSAITSQRRRRIGVGS